MIQSRLFHPPSDEQESPPPGGWRRFLEMWEPLSPYATTSPMSTISAIASTAATAVTASTSTTTTRLPAFSTTFGPFYSDNPLTGDCHICLLPLTYDNCIPLHESTHPIHVRCLVGLLSADGRVGWSGSDFELSCPFCRAHVRGSIMIHT